MSVRMEGPESKMYSPPEKRSGNDRNDPNVNSTFSTNKLQILYTYNFYWDVFRNWNGGKMRLCCIIDIDKKSFFFAKISMPKKKLPTSWRLSSKRMCLSFNLFWTHWFVVYSYYHIRFVPPKSRFGDSDSGRTWLKNVNHLPTSHSLSQI